MRKVDLAFDSVTYITVEDLHIFAKHGHYEEERRVEQEFSVSLVVAIDATRSAKSDTLHDTLDYDAIRTLILKIFNKRSRYLLEALAHDVCDEFMKDSRLTSVDVSIRKLAVWKDGIPGVRVVKKRLKY